VSTIKLTRALATAATLTAIGLVGPTAAHAGLPTDERPSSRTICRQATAREGYLIAHLPTDERPSSRTICRQATAREGYLIAHLPTDERLTRPEATSDPGDPAQPGTATPRGRNGYGITAALALLGISTAAATWRLTGRRYRLR
jgi:hypothetical protein